MSAESCAGISNLDVLSACVYLETKISESSLSPIWAGIIGFLAAIGAAALAGYLNHRMKRDERINIGERDAIIAVQDFADELRDHWKNNLLFLRSPKVSHKSPFPGLDQARDMGTLRKLLSRVRSDQVSGRYDVWMTYAEEFYSDNQDKDASVEEGLWTAAANESGVALRALDKSKFSRVR